MSDNISAGPSSMYSSPSSSSILPDSPMEEGHMQILQISDSGDHMRTYTNPSGVFLVQNLDEDLLTAEEQDAIELLKKGVSIPNPLATLPLPNVAFNPANFNEAIVTNHLFGITHGKMRRHMRDQAGVIRASELRHAELERDLWNMTTERDVFRTENDFLKAEVSTLRANYDQAEEEMQSVGTKNITLQWELEQMTAQRDALQARIDQMSNQESFQVDAGILSNFPSSSGTLSWTAYEPSTSFLDVQCSSSTPHLPSVTPRADRLTDIDANISEIFDRVPGFEDLTRVKNFARHYLSRPEGYVKPVTIVGNNGRFYLRRTFLKKYHLPETVENRDQIVEEAFQNLQVLLATEQKEQFRNGWLKRYPLSKKKIAKKRKAPKESMMVEGPREPRAPSFTSCEKATEMWLYRKFKRSN